MSFFGQDDELVFDIETKHSFDEVGGRGNFAALGVSVAGVYSYRLNQYLCFEEAELAEFEAMLMRARRVIGFNINHFDFPVLAPYLKSVNSKNLLALDLMEELVKSLKFRPKLNDLAKATLGVSKSGHGLEAIRWYREGNLAALKSYCLDDVKITKDLFEFGARRGHLMLETGLQRAIEKVPVFWKELDAKAAVPQGSLFE